MACFSATSVLNTKQGLQGALFGYHFPFALSAYKPFDFFFDGHALFPKECSNNPTFPPACHFCENILVLVCMIEGNHFQKDIRP